MRLSHPFMQAILVMTTFGLAWVLLGIAGVGVGSDPGALLLAVLVLVAVVAAVAVLVTGARRLAAVPRQPRRFPPTGFRDFMWVNLAQALVILVAIPLLTKAGVPGLIAPVTCLVVGLHFFPLARIFDQPQYWSTGTLLVVVAAVGAATFLAGAATPTTFVVVGLPAAVVLWATALHLAVRG